ncbi:thiamine phosphate synthase [Chitinophaga vietnamensis]|uniref:thiamine phosphate synthase n=1 Tax=Chitinophaga vietnamensis TaxID=2593957 RepID=UPI0011784B0A|nr:thiamine phosphate synthase [Chitinophaga vietnamensis]
MINRLHYISQQTGTGTHTDHIRAACDAGCQWIQLRVKHQSEQDVLPMAAAARKITDYYKAALIINDFPRIAVSVGADGVHVGKNDMTVAAARAITGPDMIVGGTANTAADIFQHAADGASYVGVGPFRFTTTKENLSPILGLEGYKAIIQALQEKRIAIPVIAIGGILAEDIDALMQTGIHGIAASGMITHATEKGVLVQHLYKQLNAY